MKIQKWTIKVCDGALEMSHGFYYFIIEYYVPHLQLTINKTHNFICNDGAEGRYSNINSVMLEERELSKEDAKSLAKLKKSIVDHDFMVGVALDVLHHDFDLPIEYQNARN